MGRQVSVPLSIVGTWAYKGHVDSTESGQVDIKNEALSNARMNFVNKDPGRIIALVWGQESVLR
jgi:hypothetical protein